MDDQTIKAFLAIGAVIFIGFFGNWIFSKHRIPDVLILVFVGMVLGPDILGDKLGLVTEGTLNYVNGFRDLFLSVALVVILFDGGLCLDLRSVVESMRISAFMTIITFVLEMFCIGVLISVAFGKDFLISLTLGAILGGTSGAIVIPIANKLRILPRTKSVMIMESAVTDVLVIVAALTLLSVITTNDVTALSVAERLAIQFLVGTAIGLVAGIAWLYVLQWLHNQPLSYMITIAALFLIAGVTEMLHSSGAVAALAFGLSIGNKKYVKRQITAVSLKLTTDSNIQQFHSEITFFVRTFFFVYLGLIFSFKTFTLLHLVAGIAVIVVVAGVRWLTTGLTARLAGMPDVDRLALFGLMPRGLSAAVLATLPAVVLANRSTWTSDPELGDLFLNVTLLVIIGTTVVATIFSYLVEWKIERAKKEEFRRRIYQDV
jgi:Na+:H+ antiporter